MCQIQNRRNLPKAIKIGTKVYLDCLVVNPIASTLPDENKKGWFLVTMASHNSKLFKVADIDCYLDPSLIRKYTNKD